MGCCKVSLIVNNGLELCCSDKAVIDEEPELIQPDEAEVQDWESQVLFHTVNSRAMTEELLSNCEEAVVSKDSLNRVLENIGYRGIVHKNFDRFKKKTGYSFKKIFLSSILLGKGNNEEKVICLFSLLNPNGLENLEITRLSGALEKMISLAFCEHSKNEIKSKYLDSLYGLKPLAISNLTSRLCKGEKTNLEQLLTNISNTNSSFILSSKGIRTWALSLSISSVRPQSVQHFPINSGKILTSEEDTRISKLQQKIIYESILSGISDSSEKLPSQYSEEILSSSSDSAGPIEIKIQISPTNYGVFAFYPYEDPVAKAIEFAEIHNLPNSSREKLFKATAKLKKDLID